MRVIKTISQWIAGAAIAGTLLFAAPKAQAQTSFSFGVSVGSPGYYRPYYYSPYVYRPYYGVGYYRPYYGYHRYYRLYSRPMPRGHAYGYYRHGYRR